MVDKTINGYKWLNTMHLTMVYKPTFTSPGGTILWGIIDVPRVEVWRFNHGAQHEVVG